MTRLVRSPAACSPSRDRPARHHDQGMNGDFVQHRLAIARFATSCREPCLVDALHGHHAQARCTLTQLPRLLVGLRLIPAPSGRQVLKLKHHQAGRLPVALADEWPRRMWLEPRRTRPRLRNRSENSVRQTRQRAIVITRLPVRLQQRPAGRNLPALGHRHLATERPRKRSFHEPS